MCGLVVGAALAAPLPQVRGTLLAALTGGIVAASGSSGPSGISRRVALVTAGSGLVLTVVAFATGNDPVWAALAMAAVALLTSLAAAAGQLAALLGFLGSLAYFLVATMARVANLFELVSVGWAAAHIAVGCLGGLTAARRIRSPEGGLTSIGSILMAGAPTGDVTGWAGRRLVDTALGCAIALVATYLLWPHDREEQETVPVAPSPSPSG